MSISLNHMVRHFNRAASSYEQHHPLAKYCCDELIEQLQLINIEPQTIIDVGCGTGLASRALQACFPRAQIIQIDLAERMLRQARPRFNWFRSSPKAVLADIHKLPLATNSCDFLFANLSIQWSASPAALFEELCRVLAPNGLLMFSSLGPKTLNELRQATETIDGFQHVNDFIDIQHYGDLLMKAGFSDPVLVNEDQTYQFKQFDQILMQLRCSGVTNANSTRGKSLLGKQWLHTLQENYEAYRQDGLLPLSYEIIFAHAWKASSSTGEQLNAIPINMIGRRV